MARRPRRLLTPFQGAILHLVLIGIPFRFGFTCLFGSGNWLGGEKTLCSIYEQYSKDGTPCQPLEEFMLKDYIHRWLLWYTLALFAALAIQRTGGDSSNLGLRRLNRVLIVVTFLNAFGTSYFQHFGTDARFTSDYFSLVVFNSLLAIAVSVYVCQPTTIPTSKKPAKWSLPGTALFGGLSITSMVVVASVQILMSEEGIAQYIDSRAQKQVTAIVTESFALATLQSLLSVILLKSLRDSMTLRQLCTVCVFKFSYVPMLAWFWLPEESALVANLNMKMITSARIIVTMLYSIAYLFAGKANKVGRILSSEKEV